MSGKSERRAAREAVAEYHEARLAELVQRVGDAIDMRYDRARKNLDRHPNYVLAAYMAAGT